IDFCKPMLFQYNTMKFTKAILLFFIITLVQIAKGQDTISMRSGEIIVAKVSDVGVSEITYKKWGHLDGPNYSILKTDVSSIKYPDGSKDVFKLPPANANPPAQNNQVSPAYGGIGADIKQDGDYVDVANLFPGSPAGKAGILMGDKIVSVNGTSIRGKSVFDVSALVTGPAGTSVSLGIIHPGAMAPVEIAVTREAINNTPAAANLQTAQSLAVLSQYISALANVTNINYTMADSTVDDMSKLRICPVFYMGNALEYTGQVSATYTDYHNFMIGGNMVLDGSYGVDGTVYLIKSNKMKMTTIPFNYQGEYHTHTYCTVQHNTEKINYLGLHLGYEQKRLQEATMSWEEYYGIWGGQAEDISETSNNSNLVAQAAPMYAEIAIGPQYVWASSYKAILNDGSGLVAKRRMMIIVGLDALIYPTTPIMNSTYDSLALYKASNSFLFYNLPGSNFSSAGFRLYTKFYWGWATNNFDWGLDWELSFEENLAGIGFGEQIGLYFGL
ncbi:MAG: PDZ domain-containing protein, partial [Bacteroidia bacterium]